MQDDRHRQRLSKKACCIQFCVIAIATLQVGCSVSNITDKPAINAKNLSERLFSENKLATRLSNTEIARSTEPVTAKIEGAVSGTGVITSREKETYKLLTAWHVIKPNASGEQINIITHDGISHLAKPGAIERFGDIDLVEITFNSEKNYQIANIGNPKDSEPGEEIFISGYPLATLAVPRRIRRFTVGKVIANTSAKIPKGYQLLYSNTTLPGMSGGGVFNNYGQLIGIHGQGEVDKDLTKSNGVIVKTGTNQGIPINYYTNKFAAKYEDNNGESDVNYYLAKIKYLESITPPPSGGRYVFRSNGQELEIINLANKGLELEPKNYYLMNARGKANLHLPSPALQKYANEWVKIGMDYSHPEYQRIYQEFGRSIRASTVYDQVSRLNAPEALVDFKMAYKYEPDFTEARINASRAYLELSDGRSKNDGFIVKAIEEIDQALNFDSKNSDLYLMRAEYKMRMGDPDECNDYINALALGSFIAARSILYTDECNFTGSTVSPERFTQPLAQIAKIINFNKSIYEEQANENGHLIFPKNKSDLLGNGFFKSPAYKAYENAILAIYARGVIKWLSGDKPSACADLKFSYHPFMNESIIMSIPIDSFRSARFDAWNFNNICNFTFR